MQFTRSIDRSLQLLEAALFMDENDDIITRRFMAMGQRCALVFVDGMAGSALMAEHILRPMMRCRQLHAGADAVAAAVHGLIEAADVKRVADVAQAADMVMRGLCVVLIDTAAEAVAADVRFFVKRAIVPPQTETVVIGPHEAFTESLRDNLTLLHKLLPTPGLICKMQRVGTKVATQAAVCYIKDVCPQETVDEVIRRMTGIKVDEVLTVGMLNQLLEDDPLAPLPQTVGTERPDRAVSFLLEGQAVVLIDGSPRCLAMPMTLWHLFHAPDDSYMRWQYGSFMRIVRLAGAAVALFLPAVFVSLVVFHPLAIPMSLLTNIIQSRSVVSISLLGEALLMLTVFALINEAGMRIPGLMGGSFGLVSALILGTAAVDAGLVSPMLLIVVALSGLGSYALPDYSLSFALRMGQLLLVVAGGLLGLPGVCLGGLMLLFSVAGMQSFGRPYLAPRSPARPHNPDLILHAPVFRQRLRTWLGDPAQPLRAHGRMRRFGGGRK